ncbi:hypothetical protein MKEN_00159700 [Mycena kentingensis (nom. inval.)]|nr:hypothetical protein MKEN_00159700 [Mycena kentingensis (nom. inval.)]
MTYYSRRAFSLVRVVASNAGESREDQLYLTTLPLELLLRITDTLSLDELCILASSTSLLGECLAGTLKFRLDAFRNATASDRAALAHAATENSPALLRRLLIACSAPQDQNVIQDLFWVAVRAHSADAVALLLNLGADQLRSAPGGGCAYPIQLSVAADDVGVTRALLDDDRRTGMNVQPDDQALLQLAAVNGAFGVVQLLVSRGADIQAMPGTRATTALCMAAKYARVDILRFFLERGAQVLSEKRLSIRTSMPRHPALRRLPEAHAKLFEYYWLLDQSLLFCASGFQRYMCDRSTDPKRDEWVMYPDNRETVKLLLEYGMDTVYLRRMMKKLARPYAVRMFTTLVQEGLAPADDLKELERPHFWRK